MCYYSVVFKGDQNESAVLCTKTKTYDVKQAETSNSILILPELTFPDEECISTELTSRKVIYFVIKAGLIILNINNKLMTADSWYISYILWSQTL